MPIRSWPREERPREKLLSRGSEALSDAELLAVLLRSGVAGTSALELARRLIGDFGGLRPLLHGSDQRLRGFRGVGPAGLAQLRAVRELHRRYLAERLCREGPLTDPEQAADYLMARLRDEREEVFGCIYLDSRHRVISFETLFRGSIAGATVPPRAVVRRAMETNAAALIAAHNHPSGVGEPSEADAALTRRLKAALELVDVRLLDHLVVGDGGVVSLSERGVC